MPFIQIKSSAFYRQIAVCVIKHGDVVSDGAVLNYSLHTIHAHSSHGVCSTTRQCDTIVVDVTVFQSAAVVKDGNPLMVVSGGIVGGNDTVAKSAVLAKVNRAAFSNTVCRPSSDGEAVYHGGGGFREVYVLVQHTTHIVAVKRGNVVGITVVQIKIRGFRAVEPTIHPHIGFDFVAVDRCCVARVGAFLHINEGSCIGIGRCCIHGLLQLHGIGPGRAVMRAGTSGGDKDNIAHRDMQHH